MLFRGNRPANGRPAADGSRLLLFVEDRDVVVLLALRFGEKIASLNSAAGRRPDSGSSARSNSSAFAIGGHNNATSDRNLSTFLNSEIQGPVIELSVGAHV